MEVLVSDKREISLLNEIIKIQSPNIPGQQTWASFLNILLSQEVLP